MALGVTDSIARLAGAHKVRYSIAAPLSTWPHHWQAALGFNVSRLGFRERERNSRHLSKLAQQRVNAVSRRFFIRPESKGRKPVLLYTDSYLPSNGEREREKSSSTAIRVRTVYSPVNKR